MQKINFYYFLIISFLLNTLNIFTAYAGPTHCFSLRTQAEQDSCITADSKAQGFDSYVVYTYQDYLIIGLGSIILLLIAIFIYRKIKK